MSGVGVCATAGDSGMPLAGVAGASAHMSEVSNWPDDRMPLAGEAGGTGAAIVADSVADSRSPTVMSYS